MECSQCGRPATVKRGDDLFCGACAINRDWQEIIHLVQDARVDTPVAGSETAVPVPKTA